MKRNKHLQKKILQRVVKHETRCVPFENYWRDDGGYEDIQTPDWSDDEAYNIRLLIGAGQLTNERVTDAPWLGDGHSDPYAASYIELTDFGHIWLENQVTWRKIISNIASNVPTIVTSILISLAGAWTLYFWGPQDENHAPKEQESYQLDR